MKKIIYLIVLALILGLVLTGCSLLSNISQVPVTERSGITYLTKTLSPTDLVALWRFNGDATDSSGNGNDGTVHGATYVDHMGRQALSFDGVYDYVNVPDPDTNSSLDVDTITIEAWIYFEETITKGHKNLVRKGYYGDRCYGLSIGLRATGEIAGWVNLGSAGNSGAKVARGFVLSPGSWYHVAMTYDGESVCVYVNSTEAGISATVIGDIFDNNLSVRIGGQLKTDPGGALAFKGLIDEVRIWNTALTEEQLGDITPPVIIITTPNDGDIYLLNQAVNADWNVSDGTGTGVAIENGTVPSGSPINTEAAGPHTFTVTAADYAKNTNTKTVTYDVIKATPVITWANPADIVYGTALNSTQLNATASVAGTFVYIPPAGTVLSAGSNQNLHVDFTPTDTANYNNATEDVKINVIYNWTGFFRPVDNPDVLNVAKAGRAIPVKFSLSGYQGLDIFEDGDPQSHQIDCNSTNDVDDIEETMTAGGSSLNYDDTNDQYIYVWKTDKAWAGTCRQLVVKLIDGTSHQANFNFTK